MMTVWLSSHWLILLLLVVVTVSALVSVSGAWTSYSNFTNAHQQGAVWGELMDDRTSEIYIVNVQTGSTTLVGVAVDNGAVHD